MVLFDFIRMKVRPLKELIIKKLQIVKSLVKIKLST